VIQRSVVICLALLATGLSGLAAQSPNRAVLQRLLVAEDSRGTGADGVAPILEALNGTDTLLRRVAVRAIGRFQRPDLGVALIPVLTDRVPAVRAEAAIAMAQSLRSMARGAPVTDTSHLTVAKAHQLLTGAIRRERNDSVAGVIAEAIGRLLLVDSVQGRSAEKAILDRAGGRPNYGMAHGLFWLALARRFSGGLSDPALAMLRRSALSAPDTNLRRMAVLTLGRAGALDSATTLAASRDRDAQVRRLALAGAATLSSDARAELVRRALLDSSTIVRVGAIGAARAGANPPDCSPLITALEDHHPYVILAAIDAMGQPCSNQAEVAGVLARITGFGEAGSETDPRGWQANAHALVALAKVDSAQARQFLEVFSVSRRWQKRMYAATAAAHMRDRTTLYQLARDTDNNVREAAIAGLSTVTQHEADSSYIAALGSEGNQVLLAAGEALKGSTHPRALETILNTFDRISKRRSENDRDPRLSLLSRIGEMGSTANAERMRPYLADFDTTVAKNTAAILSRWTGTTVEARAEPLPLPVEPLAKIFMTDNTFLRVTMARASGGGSFLIRLFPREAPATVARIVRRAREDYYNDHLFQRVEPNFVIQGGGPDASEYVGDDFFMRDEVGFHSHYRGTLGISTRGRDTGDAQIFINLADNPLLDHEFTVFGEVVEGLHVVEQILEGDAIGRVEVLVR
jgi:cyclophilin family peptidyl-prolyl cis-trans isomerase/HEAT repeat protein